MTNYFMFILKSAVFDFSRNKGRTFLTSLGILIGVMSVVLLLAFGLGLKKYIQDQFESLGTNVLRVLPGQVLKNGSFSSSSSSALGSIRFDEKDLVKLSRIHDLEFVIPIYTKSVGVSGAGNTESGTLYGVSADIFVGLNLTPEYGTVFTKGNVDKRSKVVVLGPTIAGKLFGSPDLAVDQSVKVDSQSFKIIGVTAAKGGGGFGGPDLDSFVYMPYKSAYVFNTDKKFFVLMVKANANSDLDVVKQEVTDVLLKRYKIDDFSVVKQTEILNAITSIFNILNTVLVAIAAISLIVGGIGIMNIMYVTVTERIKEIGIRRALGAQTNDILYQFLIEAVILSLLGGLLGLGISYVIVLFVQQFFPAYINIQSIILALGVSSLIGIVFGVFPAKKAADLSPIDAIRYE